ncbi:MAG TPA: hypothetical protein VHZ78_02385 [Rhizomicrobium sp.]|jgi:hypothetical protein|nr:hypothetical protein [Rhizomicrobium sp.]
MKFAASVFLASVFACSSAQATPWKHYTEPTLGWTIAYPADWKIDTHYSSVDKAIAGVSFAIPDGYQPGTNLSHDNTLLSVESLPGQNCTPGQFVDPAEDVHTVHADGRTYSAATSGDAGAGNFYDTSIFVVDGTSPCIAVRYLVHSTNVGAYDPGTIKAFDAAKLTAAFNAIRATLKFGK